MGRTLIRSLILVLFWGIASGVATAAPTLLVCYPNAPGSTESAEPVMAELGQRLGGQAVYFNEVAAAEAWIEEHGQPTCAIVSLGVYLRWREDHGLVPVASTERRGKTHERYHLLVAQDAPATDLDTFGKAQPTVWSGLLDNRAFAERVVFAGKLSLGDAGVRLVSTAQPLRALRRLKSGREFEGHPVDGVVLDGPAWEELQQLASFKGLLRELYQSEPLPTPPVVSCATSDPAEVAAVVKALEGLSQDDAGKKLLQTLQLTAFRGPETEALARVVTAAEGDE